MQSSKDLAEKQTATEKNLAEVRTRQLETDRLISELAKKRSEDILIAQKIDEENKKLDKKRRHEEQKIEQNVLKTAAAKAAKMCLSKK